MGIECSRASDCGILHDLKCYVVAYSSLERVGADNLDGQSSDIVIDRDVRGAGNRRIVERQRFGRRVIGHCRAAHAADDLQVAAVLAGHLGAIDIQVISRDVAFNIDVTETVARLDVGLTAIDRGRGVHAVELLAVKGVVIRAAARVGERLDDVCGTLQ